MKIIDPMGTGNLFHQLADEELKPFRERFKKVFFQVLYKIGLVGLKTQRHETASWVDEVGRSISFADIDEDVSVVIHPTYFRALGIKD